MIRRIMAGISVGAMALASLVTFGVGTASAATTTPTIVLSGAKGTFPGTTPANPVAIVATTSVVGAVTFTVGGATITGCTSVATTTVSPFIATCPWVPTTAGPTVFGANFVPTDTVNYSNTTAANYTVNIAPPIQGDASSPISFIVDTVGTANNCGIQASFVVGDGIVFRLAANDSDLGGVALTSANVSSAYITVNGYPTQIPLVYGNHGGLGMWTGVLQTGTAAGNYSPTGPIPYTITMKTIAVPAVTKKISVVNRKHVRINGRTVTRYWRSTKIVVVTPAVPGATGAFSPNHTMSVLTLLAAPVTLK